MDGLTNLYNEADVATVAKVVPSGTVDDNNSTWGKEDDYQVVYEDSEDDDDDTDGE
jgi:hypothetical protein